MGTAQRSAVVVRPSRRIFQPRGTLTIALVTLPPFLSLYWLTSSTGGWPYVLTVHVVILAMVGLVSRQVRRISVTVDEAGIRRRNLLGRTRSVPSSDVHSAIVVRVLSTSSKGATPQLFVLDASGRAVLRMLGSLWSRDALTAVETALEVPVQHLPAPIGRREFRLGFWRNLGFTERHPALTSTALGVAGVLVATPVLAEINSLL
ncbi:hypothetical protein [Naasia aerilata]|uniref:PH domain-containing protein n=1 Tax=Naasia aerilata TaxID=1162966 RepID=A0ABN6XPH2_9MICO|nr:hypothetical protein [Naasia aerilata]BDZ45737.1 hypothetical protein GCM10025866_16460 [Naasia aerilata]